MKLDDKCTKAVLETIEESSSYYDSFCYMPDGQTPQKLQKYSHDQIVYHIHHCDESGYLEGCSILGNGGMITVNDLSKAGHSYLKEVRGHSLRGRLKTVVNEEGRDGLKALIRGVIAALIDWFNPLP